MPEDRERERVELALRGWVDGGLELRRAGIDTLGATLQLIELRHENGNGERQLDAWLALASPERFVLESDLSAAGILFDAVRSMRGMGVGVVF